MVGSGASELISICDLCENVLGDRFCLFVDISSRYVESVCLNDYAGDGVCFLMYVV